MATLNVRSFPSDLHTRLKERAKLNGRSVAAEVTQMVKEALEQRPRFTANDLKDPGGPWKDVDIQAWLDKERDW